MTDVDIKEFATRVERFCDFLLDQIEEKTGTEGQVFIQDLKRDAADIHLNSRLYGITLSGLDDHIRGIRKSE
jgi:hypothetical protein